MHTIRCTAMPQSHDGKQRRGERDGGRPRWSWARSTTVPPLVRVETAWYRLATNLYVPPEVSTTPRRQWWRECVQGCVFRGQLLRTPAGPMPVPSPAREIQTTGSRSAMPRLPARVCSSSPRPTTIYVSVCRTEQRDHAPGVSLGNMAVRRVRYGSLRRSGRVMYAAFKGHMLAISLPSLGTVNRRGGQAGRGRQGARRATGPAPVEDHLKDQRQDGDEEPHDKQGERLVRAEQARKAACRAQRVHRREVHTGPSPTDKGSESREEPDRMQISPAA